MAAKYKKRPDGRYRTKVYVGNGEYKYIYARTVKELELKAEELRYSMHKGGDIQTTLNIYTHVTAEHKKTEINKLDTFLQARFIG